MDFCAADELLHPTDKAADADAVGVGVPTAIGGRGPKDPGARCHEWEESWAFDFVSDDGRFGGYCRLALVTHRRRAWFWAAVVGDGRPLVALRTHEADWPKPPGLEVRAPGLWVEMLCESPFDHWSVGLEALAVAMDDAAEGWGGERGLPTPIGFDLGWVATGGPVGVGPGEGGGFDQSCRVEGEVLLGRERISVDGWGSRRRRWGRRDWWAGAAGGGAWAYLNDGGHFGDLSIDVEFDPTGLPVSSRADFDSAASEAGLSPPGPTEGVIVATSPVLVPVEDSPGASAGDASGASAGDASGASAGDARLVRWLCRYQSSTGDQVGAGWAEWQHPALRD